MKIKEERENKFVTNFQKGNFNYTLKNKIYYSKLNKLSLYTTSQMQTTLNEK